MGYPPYLTYNTYYAFSGSGIFNAQNNLFQFLVYRTWLALTDLADRYNTLVGTLVKVWGHPQDLPW